VADCPVGGCIDHSSDLVYMLEEMEREQKIEDVNSAMEAEMRSQSSRSGQNSGSAVDRWRKRLFFGWL